MKLDEDVIIEFFEEYMTNSVSTTTIPTWAIITLNIMNADFQFFFFFTLWVVT